MEIAFTVLHSGCWIDWDCVDAGLFFYGIVSGSSTLEFNTWASNKSRTLHPEILNLGILIFAVVAFI
jgi:hypothetical protein